MDSDSDAESCLLTDTGIENGESFQMAWKRDVKDFLHREEYIGVRGTSVSEEELDFLNIQYDIDGVSIRWKDVGKGLALDYTHLTLAPRKELDIRPIYSVLKKHMNLSEYKGTSLQTLKDSFGCQIMYYGGWETWLSFVPKHTDRGEYPVKLLRDMTLRNIRLLQSEFQEGLKELVPKGLSRATLKKNNLDDLSKMFVLPGDRHIVLSVFQDALERTKLVLPGFLPMMYTFRFGEKCASTVQLPIADENAVEDICVHVGISISNGHNDLLWCREGVNGVVGRRGQITSTLSFFECVNFQSNLDERKIDVGRKLLEICHFPDYVRFVQLYSDSPHRRPGTIVHPVSGCVLLAEGIFGETSQHKLRREALQYMSEIRNNFYQLREGTCRMEFVTALPTVFRELNASELIEEEHLLRLLKDEPMFVPFSSSEDVIGCVREVGLYLCEQMLGIYRTRGGTGDSTAVWDAFQYECAVERMLWGNPFCGTSRPFSVNLGVGVGNPSRSLTDQKGFLCLEDSSSCCADEKTMPPLTIYSKNGTVHRQISRVFGLNNYIKSSKRVLGRRIVTVLLEDLHDTGKVFMRFEEFVLFLKKSSGHNDNKRIVGGITVEDLATKFAQCRNFKWPMIFGTVKTLLGNETEKVAELCVEGIHALDLGYFPAVRTLDGNRKYGLNWVYTYGFWVLTDTTGRDADYEAQAASLHLQVLCVLEKFKVCHTSHYEKTVFPWLKSVLEKVAEKKLSREETLIVLAFVSGVALLMNGCYVDYLNLSRLERKLPLTQVMLRMLEVQCKFRLGNVQNFALWKLHPSIPHKLQTEKPKSSSNRRSEVQQVAVAVEPVRDEDEIMGMETTETDTLTSDQVTIARSRHMPANVCCSKVVWSPLELIVLKEVAEECRGTRAEKYRLYQEKCRQKGIPDRSLWSFVKKITRMLSKSSKQ